MTDTDTTNPPLPLALLKLARPTQWSKSAFVLIGPMYATADGTLSLAQAAVPALAAAVAFALLASSSYAINDLIDAPRDRLHPRKRRRPIASGAVSPTQAVVFSAVLLLATVAILVLAIPPAARVWVGLTLLAYAVNVNLYSFLLKRIAIADVTCLSLGFVIRVIGGCAATMVTPSTWLLNSTFFLAMFLAFGKRLGERRTMSTQATDATSIRPVQSAYTDDLLRMTVVVTAVATLLTYAGYVQARETTHLYGFNLLWLTMIPATYALLRCMVLLEQGRFDDPTELASRDRPFQVAALLFALITAMLVTLKHAGNDDPAPPPAGQSIVCSPEHHIRQAPRSPS